MKREYPRIVRILFGLIVAMALIGFPPAGWSAEHEPGDASEPETVSDEDNDEDEENGESEGASEFSVTEHVLNINGRELRYTATTGYIILRKPEKDEKKREKLDDEDGLKPVAKMFFVAYTLTDETDPATRPVMFSFNGGPGASSIWLHMGGLGPQRTALTERGEALPPPPRLEDNPETWIDKTDLVFVDPVSTGFSRAEPGEDPKQFHGYKQDIESVGEFIRLYLTNNERWVSPKFIVGESYGTTRAAGLSDYLQNRHGIYLNGIVLVSSVLNFQTLDESPGNDTAFPLFLPSFTAAAWYHTRLPEDLQGKPLREVLEEVEQFASDDYLLALFRGQLEDGEKRQLAERLSRYTGLDADFIAQRNLRIRGVEFRSRLLRDEGLAVGRFDSRYTGYRYRPGTDGMEFDPSFEAVKGPFTATFNDYIRRDLEFESELPYETLANVWPWKFQESRYLNVAESLREAMLRNPYLRVWILAGYYDLATPYFAARQTTQQMGLPEEIRGNITTTTYPSGHMLFVDRPVLGDMKRDLVKFLESAILPDSEALENAAR